MNPSDPINFAALADALLPMASTLCGEWLSGGKTVGHEYVVDSVWRAEKSASLKVCISGEKAGHWADFGGPNRGRDLVSLYAAVFGKTAGEAAVELAHDHGLTQIANIKAPRPGGGSPVPPRPPPTKVVSIKQKPDESWKPMAPVPENMKATATFRHPHRTAADIMHTATYQVGEDLHGYVVRFRKSDGGKETIPYVCAQSDKDGSMKWVWKTWEEPRPLYFPSHQLPGTRTVILVEGEKKADALQALLDAGAPGVYCVTSWVGGCNGWGKANWEWVKGSSVICWPDCDGKRLKLTAKQAATYIDAVALEIAQAAQPILPAHKQGGMAAMLGIGARLRADFACTVQLLPIPEPLEVADGWDCADAIDEGWDFARVMDFFAKAFDMPDAEAVKPGDNVKTLARKKIDSPKALKAAKSAAGEATGDGDSADPAGGGGGARTPPPDGTPEWLEPFWDGVKKRWNASRKLVIRALREDHHLKDVLWYDQLRNEPVARYTWPWTDKPDGPLNDAVDLQLGDWLTETYKLPAISRAALSEAILTVAHARPFHPIGEWLSELVWDKRARLDKWLLHVLGHKPGELLPKQEKYLALVGRFWLIGMVNRVMNPGCKFDYMPVLEGKGGIGKSTLMKVLASEEYFSDTQFDIGRGKEGMEQLKGIWLYEFAELSNLSRSEANAVKAFMSSQTDRFRGAYGKTVQAHPRQLVFGGSTNEKQYLGDRTGNRRFWPVYCANVINVEYVTKFRDQLFAEAYAAHLRGDACSPTRDQEAELFESVQGSRLKETPVTAALFHLLTRTGGGTMGDKINNLCEFVRIDELCLALGSDAGKASVQLANEVRGWLEGQGWERGKKMINGFRSWGYLRPHGWPMPEAEDEDATPPAGPPTTGGGASGGAGATEASLAATFNQQGADDEPF